MKIYLAAPMLGDRSALDTVKRISKYIVSKGHVLLTPHVSEDVLDVEKGITPEEIFERDMKLLRESDVLVAEVSYPSLGVGFEIAVALMSGKKVYALCEESRCEKTSALIRGITWPNFRLLTYNLKNLYEVLNRILEDFP